ncbi:MAG TPA: hypothetical protein VJ385_04080 [Fibrobacteria bacterium]|nr:hypothetical protein [Fibrobacteria bacterium]
MSNWTAWIKGGKMKKDRNRKDYPTLEDVTPMHPEEYPAKHMKERLDSRRDMLDEIEERGHPTGLPDGSWPSQ